MRPSRMLVLGLAGLVALHVFMLAGHGSHDAPMVSQLPDSQMGGHASASASPSPAPAARFRSRVATRMPTWP